MRGRGAHGLLVEVQVEAHLRARGVQARRLCAVVPAQHIVLLPGQARGRREALGRRDGA